MSSTYESRIIRAALRLERASREHDDGAQAHELAKLMQLARLLRRERGGHASESYVEREEP